MSRYLHLRLAVLVLACSSGFSALAAQDFPEGATSPSADELVQRLAGKVFDVQLADGTSWRLEYKANGFYWVDTSRGFKASGTWRTEPGNLCNHLKGRDPRCDAVRVHQDLMHIKRDNGELIRLVPR